MEEEQVQPLSSAEVQGLGSWEWISPCYQPQFHFSHLCTMNVKTCWILVSVIRKAVISKGHCSHRGVLALGCSTYWIKTSLAWLHVPTRHTLNAKLRAENSQTQKNQAQTVPNSPFLLSLSNLRDKIHLINPDNLTHGRYRSQVLE